MDSITDTKYVSMKIEKGINLDLEKIFLKIYKFFFQNEIYRAYYL